MKIAIIVARILLGALYVMPAVMYFLHLMPESKVEGNALTFFIGLNSSGYFLPMLKSIELICGLALILGQFVPLAAVILFPITVNILLYHAFLAPQTVVMSVVMLALHLFLAFSYRERFSLILARR